MIEILAPAGNKESFLAAIHNGADAVYLGLKQFNARESAANNFVMEELGPLISYAHIFGVRVYLTVNTLIKEAELNDACKMVYDANQLGVDAFIVQDIGLAAFLHKIFPAIELHASTQMGIHNAYGAMMAEKVGVKRIVLSRETSLEEIRKIKKQTRLELEFFVQGALCVAFSGNCELSHALSAKSANRGECTQPCRHKFTAEIGNQPIAEGYLLSAKDISMTHRLQELHDAGITSFKIEGRARRAGYVAEATRTFREILENNFVVTPQQDLALKQVFNRGEFCEGYLDQNKSNIIFPTVPGNIGVSVGRVVNFSQGNKFNVVRVVSELPIAKGDGLKFLRDGKEVTSAGVYDISQTRPNEYSFTTTAVVQPNDEVRLISRAAHEQMATERKRKLKVIGFFTARAGEKPTFTIEYHNYSITVQSDEVAPQALSAPTTEAEVLEQLGKTGNEVFVFVSIRVELEGVFLRKMQLNELRRKALIALTKAISDDYLSKNRKDLGVFTAYSGEVNKYRLNNEGRYVLVNVSSETQLTRDLVTHASGIAFNPPEFTTEIVKSFVQKVKAYDAFKKVFLYLPPFANSDDIALIDKIMTENKGLGVVANNLYGFAYVLWGCPVIAGPQLNIYNSRTIDWVDQFGIVCNVVSPELTEAEALAQNQMTTSHCLHFAFGKEVLMNLVHCPIQSMSRCTCETCKFNGDYNLVHQNGEKLKVQRTKVVSCTFNLSRLRKLPKALFGLSTNLFLDFSGCEQGLVNAVVQKLLLPIE